jgi:hypothetical protein
MRTNAARSFPLRSACEQDATVVVHGLVAIPRPREPGAEEAPHRAWLVQRGVEEARPGVGLAAEFEGGERRDEAVSRAYLVDEQRGLQRRLPPATDVDIRRGAVGGGLLSSHSWRAGRR